MLLFSNKSRRRASPLCRRMAYAKKGRASLPTPNSQSQPSDLDLENSHDLERVRIDDQDLLPDDDELKSSPFRIDHDDSLRQRMEAHVARNAGADRDREVDVG